MDVLTVLPLTGFRDHHASEGRLITTARGSEQLLQNSILQTLKGCTHENTEATLHVKDLHKTKPCKTPVSMGRAYDVPTLPEDLLVTDGCRERQNQFWSGNQL